MSEPQPKKTKKNGERPLNVWVDSEVHRAAKVRAAQEDTTLTEVVEQALRKFLNLPDAFTEKLRGLEGPQACGQGH